MSALPPIHRRVRWRILALLFLVTVINSLTASCSALVIAGSIIAHSSTDVLMAHWLERNEPADGEPAPAS